MPREPEAMFWAFEAVTVLLPDLSLGNDKGNRTRSLCDCLPDVLSGEVWLEEG